MDSVTIAIALTGLITTLAAPLLNTLLTTRQTARKQMEAWRRDQRVVVYAEAMAHAQVLDSFLVSAQSPYSSPRLKRPDSLPAVDMITARMRLIGSASAFEAWDRLRDAEDAFWDDVFENGHGLPLADMVATEPLAKKIVSFYDAVTREF